MLAIAAILAIVVAAGGTDAPERAVLLTVTPSPATVLDGAIVELVPDELLTSEVFRPRVTFRIRARDDVGVSAEFCFEYSDADTIVFGHIMGCVDEVRIIHVGAMDCGGIDDAPDADTVAAAMLARPQLGAVDRGVLGMGVTVPDRFLRAPLHGRVIDVVGTAETQFDVVDPDGCRFLPTPGSEAIPTEIRRDLQERYVLIDARGGLVVVRAGSDGQDGIAAKAEAGRGYGRPGPEGIWHMLSSIYDIGFD